jgi:deoxyribonuclease V
MKLALDVHYPTLGSVTAGVLFNDWCAETPAGSAIAARAEVAEYQPGRFFERELPCLLDFIKQQNWTPEVILVDGYVFLDGVEKPGLGKYFFDALDAKTPIIGVAKTSFAAIDARFGLLRGDSKKPLFITCVGMELEAAKANIAQMHGQFRLPTLLKWVDQLCRGHLGEPLKTSSQMLQTWAIALLFCMAQFAQAGNAQDCAAKPHDQYLACVDRNERELIQAWPQYLARVPVMPGSADSRLQANDAPSARESTLVFSPISGNRIRLTSYFPAEDADDAARVLEYRVQDVFPKLGVVHVTESYYESIHHTFYRIANGEQIVADGAPVLSPNGARLLLLSCGESELGRVAPVFDIFAMDQGWVKRVYQHPDRLYALNWCPTDVTWRSNNEISFRYIPVWGSGSKQAREQLGLIRFIRGSWRLIRQPPTQQLEPF